MTSFTPVASAAIGPAAPSRSPARAVASPPLATRAATMTRSGTEASPIITQASVDYKSLAHDASVQKLSKIKYRNGLREAIYNLADELAEC